MSTQQPAPWEQKAAAKRAQTHAKIPREWLLTERQLQDASTRTDLTGAFIESFLTADEIAITALPSLDLVARIRQGEHTASKVTRAFCHRTAVAQQINNCLHEIFFEQAFQRAEDLDEYFQRHGETMGPLHGLPISLKDQLHVAGNDTSMGFIGWLDTFEGDPDPKLVRKVDSQLVEELRGLGAVLYCKTSLPQTLLIGETENNVIGRTLNPVNMRLSCGGSSGGEGALAALGGSPVGVGTDIGGSVRIPAAFCGITSIKPTQNRFPYRGLANTSPGQTTYASSVGFMSPSLDSLHLIMTSLLSTQPWLRDPNVVPIPWRQSITDATLSRAAPDGSAKQTGALKLGLFLNDGMVTPHPPIQRGLKLVETAIKQAGHKIVPWDPPAHDRAHKIHGSFLLADGGHDVHKQLDLSGEPLIPPLKNAFRLKDPLSLLEYQAKTVEGRNFEAQYVDYLNSTADDDGQPVDAVIMPVAPHAAVIPGKFMHTAYTDVINLFGYTSAVIRVTKADKNIDKPSSDFKPVSDKDARNWSAYDPEIYHGAPVGVQLVGRKFEEEKIWAVAKIVERILENAGSGKTQSRF